MAISEGSFVWYELLTTDTDAAQDFYRKIVGWDFTDSGLTDRRYSILSIGQTPVGGLMTLPAEAKADGARPVWFGYIAVSDVDAFVQRVVDAGGSVHRAAESIAGVGRFALVADPQGAPFVLFKSMSDRQMPSPASPSKPGFIGWHELFAADRESAFAFYSALFGWTKVEAFDMGEMGIYQLFAIDDVPVGGMMTKHQGIPSAFWTYYFNVDDTKAATSRVTENGGRILNGPHQVPGGNWVVQCLDPQGAMFALVGPGN